MNHDVDPDLDRATVRELILRLAEVEDGQRRAVREARGRSMADLVRREKAIVAALHRHGSGPDSGRA